MAVDFFDDSIRSRLVSIKPRKEMISFLYGLLWSNVEFKYLFCDFLISVPCIKLRQNSGKKTAQWWDKIQVSKYIEKDKEQRCLRVKSFFIKTYLKERNFSKLKLFISATSLNSKNFKFLGKLHCKNILSSLDVALAQWFRYLGN